jgi:glutathione synthase/RimK-type ligase-like ATP-grasp enzyme
LSFSEFNVGAYWRPHEQQAAQRHLGKQVSIDKRFDYFAWRVNTESVNQTILNRCQNIEEQIRLANPEVKIINSMSSYKFTNNKDECFDEWSLQGISTPKYITYSDKSEILSSGIRYPFLLRLNDGVTGEDTFLIRSEKELDECIPLVDKAFRYKKRISTKKIAVEFIDTSIEEGYKVSFRIIVAGNKVVVGYARISDDWLAITKQFTEDKKEHFIKQNKRLQDIINKNHDEIVRSVSVLGLKHVGIDVIADKEDNLYFLEVQPFYFSGNTSRTTPPFWNPYKPPELVKWLVEDKNNLSKEIPIYYNLWLDKSRHFDLCYKSLSESF